MQFMKTYEIFSQEVFNFDHSLLLLLKNEVGSNHFKIFHGSCSVRLQIGALKM